MPDTTGPARFGEERNTPSPTTSLANPEALRCEPPSVGARALTAGAFVLLFVRASRSALSVRRRPVLTRWLRHTRRVEAERLRERAERTNNPFDMSA